MVKRNIIKIDEEKCTGCGQCIPNCPEGALQIIDGKARLVSDLFCDGLGACIGHCPEGAIDIEERDAEVYDEERVMENIVKQGKSVIKAHLEHLKDHNQDEYLGQAIDFLKEKGIEVPLDEKPSQGHEHADLPCGCPGSKVMDFREKDEGPAEGDKPATKATSQLRQWPVQLMLVPPNAPYLNGADLLIAADCVPFAHANFHDELLRGKSLLIGCPKLDDAELYVEKITHILKNNEIKSLTVANMEVPCCFGLYELVKNALDASGKDIPFKQVVVGIKGELSE